MRDASDGTRRLRDEGRESVNGVGDEALLRIVGLNTEFRTRAGTIVANKNINLALPRGKTMGIVGESGSGKSVLCRAILGLVPSPPGFVTNGEIWFDGENLLDSSDKRMQAIRGSEIAMIFQDPMTTLNPVWRIGDQITEGLRVHGKLRSRESKKVGESLLRQVAIPSPERRIDDYPHHMSGGMRQRVMIATAIASRPKLLLADESTTALDVTIQDQILSLMMGLQERVGMSMILVSHDLGIVAETSDIVAVMYAGQVMEIAGTEAVFDNPRHPYTVALLKSIPRMGDRSVRLVPIKGQPPDLLRLPSGCPFSQRCSVAARDCAETPVEAREVEPGHLTACLYPERVSR